MSWLPSGSTPPPACRTHSSPFDTKSWILEGNEVGWGWEKEGRGRRWLLDHPCGVRSPHVEFGASPDLWCVGLPGYKPCVAIKELFR